MNTVPFDTRMGSDIFSIVLAHAEKCRFDKEMSDENIDDTVKAELDVAVYVQKYTENAFERLHRAMIEYNTTAKDTLIHSEEVAKFLATNPDYKYMSLLTLAKDAGGESLANKILQGQKIIKDIYKADLEIVMYRGQAIYPVLVE